MSRLEPEKQVDQLIERAKRQLESWPQRRKQSVAAGHWECESLSQKSFDAMVQFLRKDGADLCGTDAEWQDGPGIGFLDGTFSVTLTGWSSPVMRRGSTHFVPVQLYTTFTFGVDGSMKTTFDSYDRPELASAYAKTGNSQKAHDMHWQQKIQAEREKGTRVTVCSNGFGFSYASPPRRSRIARLLCRIGLLKKGELQGGAS